MKFDKKYLDELSNSAKESERLRMFVDLRTSVNDCSQRIINALEPGTFVPIHRHRGTSETVIVLRGSLKEVFYSERGEIINEFLLQVGGECVGVQIPPGQWHSIEVLEVGTIIFEGKDGEYAPSYMWNVNGWLCDKLGLTVKSQTQVTVPTTYKEDIYSETLGETVKAGDATGMSAIVTTETEEGITIESECIGKVYAEDEFDKNEWTVMGEPDTTIVVNRPATVELTCATIVNRLPDVINAKPGFIPTHEMDELMYRPKSLDTYLK